MIRYKGHNFKTEKQLAIFQRGEAEQDLRKATAELARFCAAEIVRAAIKQQRRHAPCTGVGSPRYQRRPSKPFSAYDVAQVKELAYFAIDQGAPETISLDPLLKSPLMVKMIEGNVREFCSRTSLRDNFNVVIQ